jgi:hypothetical protein
MRAYIAVVSTLILGGAALLTGQDICAAEAKAKRNGPVILMLDPQGNKLDIEGR